MPTPEEIEQKRKADEAAAAAASQEDSKKVGFKYYRSDIAALTVHLGPPLDGQVAPQTARFTPFYERVNGDDTKVGYLETDDPRVIERCDSDFHCTSISKKEYTDATTEKFDDDGNNVGKVRRAAF